MLCLERRSYRHRAPGPIQRAGLFCAWGDASGTTGATAALIARRGDEQKGASKSVRAGLGRGRRGTGSSRLRGAVAGQTIIPRTRYLTDIVHRPYFRSHIAESSRMVGGRIGECGRRHRQHSKDERQQE